MPKRIIISKCADCPLYCEDDGRCIKESRYLSLKQSRGELPDWCPLLSDRQEIIADISETRRR